MEPFNKIAQELLDEITGMLSVVEAGTYTSLVNNLLSAKNVVVTGEGRGRYVMGTFARRLSRLGRMVTMQGEAVGRNAGRGDVVLAASLKGERGPLPALAEVARKRGALVYAFVGEASCILASHADYVVTIAPQTRTPFETIAGAGRISTLAFDEALMIYLDVVVTALQDVLGLDAGDVAEAAGED
ncbi:MAG TPA: SIS domain-containing protein [Planctomycetota bacterium]|nr:SIS domain-containing protein [Planctomycetota bacterium]